MTADIDIGNDDGLFMARIFAAFAAKESGRRSARIRRKMDQNATAGLPYRPARPFGYEDDKITIREDEAAIIRVLVDRYLAGESLRPLASWLNTTGVPTTKGAEHWQTPTLRQMLSAARLAGLGEHRGQIIGNAVWEPIITVKKREQPMMHHSNIDQLTNRGGAGASGLAPSNPVTAQDQRVQIVFTASRRLWTSGWACWWSVWTP